MKKLICLFLITLTLSSCKPCPFIDVNGRCYSIAINMVTYEEVFKDCTSKLSQARKGVNYTTNEDEDYDEAIDSCRYSAADIASVREYRNETNSKENIKEHKNE